MASLMKSINQTINNTKYQKYLKNINPKLKQAIKIINRCNFVSQTFQDNATKDQSVPIGYGQVASQPFLITLMIQLLDLKPEHKVLEIGTGSGYQTALLSQLAQCIVSLEIIPELLENAEKKLQTLQLNNIILKNKNGWYGDREHAPYDRIILSAATPNIPEDLLTQLKVGGKLILPLGGQILPQKLVLLEKVNNMEAKSKEILPVKFVSMTGIKHDFKY